MKAAIMTLQSTNTNELVTKKLVHTKVGTKKVHLFEWTIKSCE